MSKGSSPSSPDPYTTAAAQYQYSTQAADYNSALNDVNTSGPTGSTNYAITGYDPTTGAPIRTQSTTLSPAEQGIFNTQTGVQQGELNTAGTLLGNVNKVAATGEPTLNPLTSSVAAGPVQTSINTSGVPGIAPTTNYEQYGQSTALAGEEAAMQPQMSQQYEQLDASLRNSGAQPGTPAYDNAMAAFDANENNAQTQAAGAAITAGTGLQNTEYGEEANTNSQLFGEAAQQETAANAGQQQQFTEGTSNAQLNNSADTEALSNYAQQMGIPLNDLSSILSGTQVQTPSAVSSATSSVSAPDIMSAFQNQYAGQLSAYNANVASTNADVGDAATLGYLAYLAAA